MEIIKSNEILERPYEQAVVIDFDRTLADPDTSMERFYHATARFLNRQTIEDARKNIENDGGSFNPLGLILKENSAEFRQNFLSIKAPKILYPDAEDFLKLLKSKAMPYMVLTYGASDEWQRLKIEASGYKGEYAVIENSKKGKILAGWKNETKENGLYTVPGKKPINAKMLCLIDDKAGAFEGLPNDCTGFVIRRSNTLLKSQEGEISESIVAIKNFGEIVVVNGHLMTKKASGIMKNASRRVGSPKKTEAGISMSR